ncbi:MAG TPA: HEAT repeat domain-containing protein [Planctomycetota bacterium]|nr:HEAT repeat domain-containing protein [Planctomycetota bacterium]HRR83005.1 HEAT repeat domain-containing protein [Planctomycetota bacterium]HRT96716.1 HEAT repeat domain-containing protein [Planctomycetota bacterium]
MRRHCIAILALTIAVWAAPLGAGEPDPAELTKEFTGEKPASERTPEQLDAAYAKVLDALMPDMGNEDPNKRGGPTRTLERIAFQASRPGAEADRAACAKAIAARLGPDVPPLARTWLIRMLERIGRAEAVAALGAALGDKDENVRESARRALQKNSAKEATLALIKAVATADTPAWRAALLNAIAERRDAAALDTLVKEAASDNDDVRTAAVRGLGKLGDKAGAAPIAAALAKGSPAAKQAAVDAYLMLADALTAAGDKALALGIYKKLLAADSPPFARCGAIVGIARAGGVEELPTILGSLAEPADGLLGASVEALCMLEGEKATPAIAARVQGAAPLVKLALLQALARRADKRALPTFVAAVEDADPAVRDQAVRGLGLLGDTSVVPLLLKVAAQASAAQATARRSLEAIRGDGIDKALLAALEGDDLKLRAEAIRALATRRFAAATPALLKAAEDPDGGIRAEALKALGALAPTEAMSAVAALLVKTQDDGTRNEAKEALVNIARRDLDADKRSEAVLKALETASGPARLSLLTVAGRIGGDKSLAAVRAALKDQDEKVKDAAIRALAEWPDAAAAPDLLEIARTAATETHQVLAIRGYIRVCRLQSNRPAAETAKMLIVGLETAKRPDEKRQAISGLAEARDLAALQAVVPCLEVEALKEEAAHAAVRIGRDIWNHPANAEAVKAAMQKVLEVTKNDGLRKQAQETLDRAQQKLREAKPAK